MTTVFFVPISPQLHNEFELISIGVRWNVEKNLPSDFFPVNASLQLVHNDPTLDLSELNREQTQVRTAIESFFQADWQRAVKVLPFLCSCLSGSDFQIKVWQAIATIPVGKTLTYQQLATQIGHDRAYRAVGSACGKNPFPFLIPCHRVLATHGIGGYGFGVALKRQLLKHEHVLV